MTIAENTDVRGWVKAALQAHANLHPGTVQVVTTKEVIKLYEPGEQKPFAIVWVERP